MKKKILFLTMCMVLFNLCFVIAIPTYHQFYGDILDSNSTLVSGEHAIRAEVGGILYGQTVGSAGHYGIDSVFFVEDLTNEAEINFYVDGILSGSFIFQSEATTELDLIWPCGDGIIDTDSEEECDGANITTSCTSEGFDKGTVSCSDICRVDISDCENDVDDGGDDDGGGGGGGGGWSIIQVCEEKWACTGWSECVDERKSRTCTDENKCGSIVNKPIISTECVQDIAPVETPEDDLPPALNIGDWFKIYWPWLLGLLAILIILTIILILRKSTFKKKEVKEIKPFVNKKQTSKLKVKKKKS